VPRLAASLLRRQARLPRATGLLPLLGIRQNDTNRGNLHIAISMRMHDCLTAAVASPVERGLQVKADPMSSVSRRNMLAAAAAWPLQTQSPPRSVGHKSKDPFDDR
jgi:hypothetical protein